MSDEKTPGRAFYDAASEVAADFTDCTDLDLVSGWDALDDEHQAALEAGAQRVLKDGYPNTTRQLADRDQLERDRVADLTASANAAASILDEIHQARRENERLAADIGDLAAQLIAWPTCPDGCGCRLGTEDADARDCACDGPCCMECRENGYPDKPSYRDIAVAAECEQWAADTKASQQ